MEGPRPPREDELNQIFEFLNHELRPDAAWPLSSEYPTAFAPSNIHNMRIITESEKVLSHAILKPIILKTPVAVLKIAAIGSVVTESSHRNQGLSRKVIEDCVIEAEKQDCDIAMLWSNLYEFYQKMNFELSGVENSFVFEQEFAVPEHQLKFLKTTQISAESIYRLYSQHTVTSVRTAEDIRKFLQIPNASIYTAWDTNNQLVAYAVEGKGADLTNYIHEWGGSVPTLLALFSHIRKTKGTAYTVITPAHAENLNQNLRALPGVIFSQGFLGMIRLVRSEALFQKIKRAARSLGINDIVLEKRGPEYLLGVGDNLIAISDEKDLVRVLFGSFLEIPHLTQETQEKLKRILPLPLWIWGWDSI